MTDDIDYKIKKRNDLTKILEYSFINDAAKKFLERHSICTTSKAAKEENNADFIDKWVKYTSQFTRIWLNYLDDKEFEELAFKKLKVENTFNNPNSSKDSQ